MKSTNCALGRGCCDCYLQIKKWVNRVSHLPPRGKARKRKAALRILAEFLSLCNCLLLCIGRNTVPCQHGGTECSFCASVNEIARWKVVESEASDLQG